MGPATRIATKDLKLRIRDRSAFILGIFAPLILAIIFKFVFGAAFTADSLDLRFGFVDLDASETSQAFHEVLEGAASEGILTLSDFDTADGANAALEAGDVNAYYLIDSGLEDAVRAGDDFVIRVVGDVDAPTSTQITARSPSSSDRVSPESSWRWRRRVHLLDGPPPQDVSSWGQEAAGRGPSFVMTDVATEVRQLDGTTYFAAGMAVFFLFFTVQYGVIGLLEEQRDGTLARLLAAPIRRTSVITAKALLSGWLGIISLGVLIVATHFLMGAIWGPPLGVTLLVVAGVFSAVAIMGLVGSVAKTPEAAGNLASIVAVILGMLGGTFFPVGQGDDFLSKLTYLTPHAWFLRGLASISGGASWTAALPSVAALSIFGLVTGSIAWVALRRRITA